MCLFFAVFMSGFIGGQSIGEREGGEADNCDILCKLWLIHETARVLE